ncbi:hypothetical protein ACFU9Y_15860 [Streptomyces sp. NPDC057621]|uniref:hypothetical protein n=1 Tax=Streptomyces sp. NPDC057621 TaxID=3346186 RepID=UPI0036A7C3D7
MTTVRTGSHDRRTRAIPRTPKADSLVRQGDSVLEHITTQAINALDRTQTDPRLLQSLAGEGW